MGLFVNPLSDHVCLSLTHRTRIHASRDGAMTVMKQITNGGVARTVCGVDAKIVAHPVTGSEGDAVVASWPPPLHGETADRCDDCAERLGLGGRERKGSHHWQSLRHGRVAR